MGCSPHTIFLKTHSKTPNFPLGIGNSLFDIGHSIEILAKPASLEQIVACIESNWSKKVNPPPFQMNMLPREVDVETELD